MDQPWGDLNLPWRRWQRKLYNAPPRFTVMEHGSEKLCELHYRLVEQLADNEVAERRGEQARLNGREFMKVHTFNLRIIDEARSTEDAALGREGAK
jgi:hypothetical protein